MMRSLFSGVSGLKNHQTRMDVIGNNISNVNTTGFKSSRVTFTDMLSQTLTGASTPQQNIGGTNPKQIGLGSSVGSVDLIFTNGSVQSTGKNTDLCLSGNGLFVVKRGAETFYTRDGAFEFDAAGNYVLPGSGLFVQGWMADKEGKLSTSGDTTNIVVPAGKSMDAEATQAATYVNNLNGMPDGYEIASVTVTHSDGTTETVSEYIPRNVVTLNLNSGRQVQLDETADYDFKTGDDVKGQKLYKHKVSYVEANATGTVDLALDTSKDSVRMNGGKVYAITGLPSTVTGLTDGFYPPSGASYLFNGKIDSNGVTVSGDGSGDTTLRITLTEPAAFAGTSVTVQVPDPEGTYYDGMDIQFQVPIQQITAKEGAKVSCYDDVHGFQEYTTCAYDGTVTTFSAANDSYQVYGRDDWGTVTAVDNEKESGVSVVYNTKEGVPIPGLSGTSYKAGDTVYLPVVTTITVYDSEGGSHDVTVNFTKTAPNTWQLSLSKDKIPEKDGTTTEVSLTSDTLTFNTSGVYTGGEGTLTLKYGNGAKDQTVDINLSGLTQYIGSSTINASADGHAMGTLSSVSIDTSGVITGTYTNGVKRAEAQVAVAQFNNASGLTKTGDSLYQESNNSGTANVKTAADLGVTITPAALEMSNVDVANEFTDMIITQRGFQSNSKIITVSDEMLETLINMKR